MKKALLAAATMMLLAANTAQADDYLTFNTGWYDVTQEDVKAHVFGLEYRYEDIYYGLRPTVGGMVTDDAANYIYAGFHWELPIYDSIYFTPSTAVGAYSHGHGKDLGYGVEFRSGIELSADVYENHRLGVAIHHLSNASLGNDNPGTEILTINYQLPIGWAE